MLIDDIDVSYDQTLVVTDFETFTFAHLGAPYILTFSIMNNMITPIPISWPQSSYDEYIIIRHSLYGWHSGQLERGMAERFGRRRSECGCGNRSWDTKDHQFLHGFAPSTILRVAAYRDNS